MGSSSSTTKRHPGIANDQTNAKAKGRGTPIKQGGSPFESLKKTLESVRDNPDELMQWLQALGRTPNIGQTVPQDHPSVVVFDSLDKILKSAQELQKLRTQKQEMLNRLSEAAGARLKNNNPAITDLSDRNRPSKLAEQFSELYDNEWTDTAEELKDLVKGKFSNEEERETSVVKLLFEVLKETYQWCAKRSEEQLRNVVAAAQLRDNDGTDQDIKDNPIIQKKCKDLLKEESLEIAESVDLVQKIREETAKSLFQGDLKCFESLRRKDANGRPHFEVFLSKCVKLCWLMACQDPPVVLEYQSGNVDLYRAYTRSGDCLDYVVWPSLLLHKGGPLLYKGVAQLKPRAPDKKEVDTKEPAAMSKGNNGTTSVQDSGVNEEKTHNGKTSDGDTKAMQVVDDVSTNTSGNNDDEGKGSGKASSSAASDITSVPIKESNTIGKEDKGNARKKGQHVTAITVKDLSKI